MFMFMFICVKLNSICVFHNVAILVEFIFVYVDTSFISDRRLLELSVVRRQ